MKKTRQNAGQPLSWRRLSRTLGLPLLVRKERFLFHGSASSWVWNILSPRQTVSALQSVAESGLFVFDAALDDELAALCIQNGPDAFPGSAQDSLNAWVADRKGWLRRFSLFFVMNNSKIIDLFAGCGGMSLGFELAGFTPVWAVEKDEWAANTYKYNHKNTSIYVGDITKISDPQRVFACDQITGIIGGPPCQGFSLSGNRDTKDPRNSLFMDFIRFVKVFSPCFFIMENVQGILSAKTKTGEYVKNLVCSVAQDAGYNVCISLLNAADYGVPQARMRVFFIGIHHEYPFNPAMLAPEKITENNPVTLWEAISDLPEIEAGQGEEKMEYKCAPKNNYQIWCRSHSLFVENHVAMRHTPRLVERFRYIKHGQSLADVPQEHMQRKRGNAREISGKVYSQNNMRPFPDKPSPTLPASFQSNFIHPFFNRNYTAREGARIQSFPDAYIFRGKRTTMSWERNLSQFQQIGNAVPPLLAKALGLMIKKYFENIEWMENIPQQHPVQLTLF